MRIGCRLTRRTPTRRTRKISCCTECGCGGARRRSRYPAVRRNFLSPMLLAFDTPSPFATVGRRTVSNVPAQALILLNDPFVHLQAEAWAKRALAQKGTATQRITSMYSAAFGRPPSDGELKACESFLDSQ